MTAVVIVSDEGLGGVVPFAHAIRDAGRVPLLITGPAQEAQLDRWREIYERVEVLPDPYDVDELVRAAGRLAVDVPLAAMFSCYDGLVVPAAQAAAELGLPHPTLAGLESCRNKHLMRTALRNGGLRTPPFGLVADEHDLARVAAEVGFPAIIKPLNGVASHLVRRVEDTSELAAALAYLTSGVRRSLRGNYSSALRGATPGVGVDPRTAFLVEAFVEGEEYSAEVVVRDGHVRRVALLHKFLVDPEGFLECGFTTPTDGRDEALWRHIEECLATLTVDNCVAHVEVIDGPEGPVLVEVNAGRPGGQIIVRAVRDVAGVDLVRETLALNCWDPPPEIGEPVLEPPVTTLSVFAPRSGSLRALEGIDAVADLPGVRAVIVFCAAGDQLDVEDKEFFAVNLLVSELDRAEVVELYDRARDLVRFRFAGDIPEASVLGDASRRDAIVARSELVGWLRARLADDGFLEVQTPLLHAAAECGVVHQYETTAVNGRTLYVRTDPEEYLKRYLTAGFDAVFEVAANVRGEVPDDDHLQEFTSLECYRRWWSFSDALDYCWALVGAALTAVRGSTATALHEVPVELGGRPVVRTFDELALEHAGIDVDRHPTAAALLRELRARDLWTGTGGHLDDFRRTPLEWLLDERICPAIAEPTFVVDFPVELGLSARERPDRPGRCLRGELYLPGGWELAHLYENLTEPAALRSRYKERLRHRVAAGLPSVELDEDLIASAALGMPPMSGIAIGVDRLFALIRGGASVSDGLLFPHEGFADAPALTRRTAAATGPSGAHPRPAATPVR
jgi:elongation factor P--beta-lysine ligase/biotin carboxylase